MTFDERYLTPFEDHENDDEIERPGDQPDPYFWCRECPPSLGRCTRKHERQKALVAFLWEIREAMRPRDDAVIAGKLADKTHAQIARDQGTTTVAINSRWARIQEREQKNNLGTAINGSPGEQ